VVKYTELYESAENEVYLTRGKQTFETSSRSHFASLQSKKLLEMKKIFIKPIAANHVTNPSNRSVLFSTQYDKNTTPIVRPRVSEVRSFLAYRYLNGKHRSIYKT